MNHEDGPMGKHHACRGLAAGEPADPAEIARVERRKLIAARFKRAGDRGLEFPEPTAPGIRLVRVARLAGPIDPEYLHERF